MGRLAVELNDAGLLLARRGAGGVPVLDGPPSPGFALLHEGRVLVGRRRRVVSAWRRCTCRTATGMRWGPSRCRGRRAASPPSRTSPMRTCPRAGRTRCGTVRHGTAAGRAAGLLARAAGPADRHRERVRHRRARPRGPGLAALRDRRAVPPACCISTCSCTRRPRRWSRLARAEACCAARATSCCPAGAAGVPAGAGADDRHGVRARDALRPAAPGGDRATAARPLAALAAGAGTSDDETGAEFDFGAADAPDPPDARAGHGCGRGADDEMLRLVQLARPAGALLHLCFTPRIAAVPGLVARLAGLRDCVMVELPHGAAATGRVAVRPTQSCGRRMRSRWCTGCRSHGDRCRGRRRPRWHDCGPPPRRCRRTSCSTAARGPSPRCRSTLGWSVGPAARALTLPAGHCRRVAVALHARAQTARPS